MARLARSLLPLAGVEIVRPEQKVMEAALELRSARGELLAQNVANADTPGYVARDLRFDQALDSLLENGQQDVQQVAHDEIVPQNVRFDGNDVDLNQQLANVSENALKYAATLSLYSDASSRLKAAASST
jgi:flagellar basal-body rod protein FlgB